MRRPARRRIRAHRDNRGSGLYPRGHAGGVGPCASIDPRGRLVPKEAGRLDTIIHGYEAQLAAGCQRVPRCTAIRERYKNQLINSWLGPGKGYGQVLGQNWIPYQATTVVTPPFPEYVSGHSTFTAAGRTILALFFGTDNFNAQVTIPAGSSKIEPGVTPRRTVVLTWKTLTDAADQAGMSRRWGGIPFQTGDMDGRTLGKVVGNDDWNKAQTFFNGTATAPA